MADKSEFESVAMVHIGAVYKTAVALCSDRQEAEDLVQVTFLKAFERFESFKKGTNCKAWLLTILRNKWVDQLRHRSFLGETLPVDETVVAKDEGDGQVSWSNCRDLLENFSDEQVITALKELPDEQRLALFLSDVEQLRQEEIGEIMCVPIGTVKSRVSRARASLKKRLLSYAKEMGFVGDQR